MPNNKFVIREYDCLYADNCPISGNEGETAIPVRAFSELETMVLTSSLTAAEQFFALGTRRGIGKVIRAQNYVGVIQTKSGSSVEILPKIALPKEDKSLNQTRKLFLRMLRKLRNPLFKKLNLSHLNMDRMPLFEIFIVMFLDEVAALIRRRIKSGYVTQEDNLYVIKGKLSFSKHIRSNVIHKERFYIEFDEYLTDIPENRLIKAALIKLKSLSKSARSQQRIKQYLFALDEVQRSCNYIQDFGLCSRSRLMEDYSLLLQWCRVFLYNKSFSNYQGEAIAYSLLFPMERIFQDYVGQMILLCKGFDEFEVKLQESQRYLFSEPMAFKLEPDIVLRSQNSVIIMDTKWKVLNPNSIKWGIAEQDVYQMHAYCQRYGSNKAILIYPRCDYASPIQTMTFSNDVLEVRVYLVDLWNIDESLADLATFIKGTV